MATAASIATSPDLTRFSNSVNPSVFTESWISSDCGRPWNREVAKSDLYDKTPGGLQRDRPGSGIDSSPDHGAAIMIV